MREFNKWGYEILKISPDELEVYKFKTFLANIVCDSCNHTFENEDVYFIAILNQIFCEKCYEDYFKDNPGKLTQAELDIQKRYLDNMKKRLIGL